MCFAKRRRLHRNFIDEPTEEKRMLRASQPKVASRMLAAKPNAAMRRDVCRMPVTPARLA
ncbi:hypothetical protein B7G54_10240 [Burkholderia puraquae]|uniref:Uncharacterized protein n=1 Tax=Burkholderia puraquae TaxID=1904757 RepID=A0A1X1PJL1_9BURK|nr:hypothetical protein B7G54_10240 [Burkholderia puraquae]